MTEEELARILSRLYPSTPWPKPFNLLKGCQLVQAGRALRDAAREIATTATRLATFCDSTDKITALFGAERPNEQTRKGVRQILGI